jgi:hypothetical protein
MKPSDHLCSLCILAKDPTLLKINDTEKVKQFIMTISWLYRVIQSSSTILKEVVGKIIWSFKCNFFPGSPPFPSYEVFTLISLLLL